MDPAAVTAPPTDADLVARAARRDPAAFLRLADRHAHPLAAWLLRRQPAEAGDVLNDALRRAWRAAGTCPPDRPRSWFFQVARTALADHLRYRADDEQSHEAVVADGLNRLADRERDLIRAKFEGGELSPADRELAGRALAKLREAVERRDETLLLPTVPDDPAELAAWLERQVAGPDLGPLIAELSAVHGPTADAPDLKTALGMDLAAVRTGGLRGLPADRLRLFLRHPGLLAELQDRAAEAGAPYWDELFDHPTLAGMVRRARTAATDDRARRHRVPRQPFYLRPWFVALATTVVILGTVVLHLSARPRPWGLSRPGVTVRADTPAAHLNALADAAAEWHSRPLDTPADLRRALTQLRDGLTAVLAAPHGRLSETDRAWLADQCVALGGRLDRLLADLDQGRTVDEVRAGADAAVDEFVAALRGRATE